MLTLRNPKFPDLQPIQTEALVDTGAVHMCIPAHVAVQLRLDEYDKKEATLADGRKLLLSYVGPLEVHFKNRVFLGGALVLGDQVMLGAIPMEDMDLVVSPKDRRVDANPQNPNFA